jgi:predicted nuclease of predicted toxin-antitoxin system
VEPGVFPSTSLRAGRPRAANHLRSFVEGYPPNVVWLQVGNCSTADIEARVRRNADESTAFHPDGTVAVCIIE